MSNNINMIEPEQDERIFFLTVRSCSDYKENG